MVRVWSKERWCLCLSGKTWQCKCLKPITQYNDEELQSHSCPILSFHQNHNPFYTCIVLYQNWFLYEFCNDHKWLFKFVLTQSLEGSLQSGQKTPKENGEKWVSAPKCLQSPHCITYQCHALPWSPPDELRDWPDSPPHVSTHPPALTLPSVLNTTLTASDSPATKISLSPQCVASRLSVYKSYTCKSKLYQTVNSLTNMSSLVWNLKLFSLNMVEIELWMVRSTYSFIIWEFYKMFLEFQGQKLCKLQRQMFYVPSL